MFASDVDGDYELFVMRADGSDRRRLTKNNVDDLNPAWAPDGRRLVFEREGKYGYEDLYLLSLRTGRASRWLVQGITDEGEPAWSPNGKWIAFRGNDGGDGSDVVARTVNKRDMRVVSSADHNSTNHSPAWSPDGRRVAVVEEYDESDVFVASFRRGGKERITPSDNGWKSELDWAPAGRCILYSSRVGDASGIYIVSANGDSPIGLYWTSSQVHAGSWSPDARNIVFTSNRKGSHDIYVMGSDGSRLRRVTTSDHNEIDPAWYGRADEISRPGCSAPSTEPSPSGSPTPSPSLTLPIR